MAFSNTYNNKNSLALFDFDGTITTKDSLIKFIQFAVGNTKLVAGLITLSPTLVLYKLGIIPNYTAKQRMISLFFKGLDEKEFKKTATEYSLNHIDYITRPIAIKKLNWHKEQGHNIVIVSASMESWLLPWCTKNNFDLISTKLESKEGLITGRFLTKNCYGVEKVNRINKAYKLNEYNYIYAYGDSKGDKQMLELADEAYYRKFH